MVKCEQYTCCVTPALMQFNSIIALNCLKELAKQYNKVFLYTGEYNL